MMKLTCYITGEDYKLLQEDTPTSRKKVSALASVIFIPVIIWASIGFVLISNVMKGSLSSSLIMAGVLATIIFIIEKNIIMAPSTSKIRKFRYTVGTIIALLGAVFIDEVLFKPEIEQELFMMNKRTIDETLRVLEESYTDPLQRAQNDLDSKYSAWQQAMVDAKNEADGSGGSGIKGVHAITKVKLAAADVCKTDYYNASAELSNLKKEITSEKNELRRQVKRSIHDEAILKRIKALFNLVFRDPFIAGFYLLMTAFLFAMEFLVVFLKGAWAQTNYERRLELMEEIGRKRMDKIRQNGVTHYESGSIYSSYRNANEDLSKKRNTSLFN